MSTVLKGRPCGPLKSKKNPNAYTKDELVNMAMKKLLITKSKASSMTKEVLCKSLEIGKIEVAKAKSTKAKSAKAKSTKAKQKKSVKKQTIPKESPKKEKSPKVKIVDKKSCIEQSKLPLKEQQIRVVNHLKQYRGLIVAHSVGSGKTLTAVTAAQCFLQDNPNGKIVVVTPVSLQDNFKKEMKAYGVKNMGPYTFYTLQGFAKEYHKKQCDNNMMLIIDEAHNLRTELGPALSRAGKAAKKGKDSIVRADVAIKCAQKAKKVLLLTATAIYNKPLDVSNLMAMIKGGDALKKREFEKLLDDQYKFDNYFRCTFSFYDIPKDPEFYPSVSEHYVEIPMPLDYYEAYRQVEHANSHLFDSDNPWVFLTGVRQASNALESCPKCEWVLNRAKKGTKMVIYSAFITFGIKRLKELFDKNKIKYVEVTGAMSKDKRTNSVNTYNENKAQIMFITKAGGEGLDLKGTREVVIFESSWNRPNEDQVIGRAVRYKSHSHLPLNERKVDVYHLLMVKPPYAANQRDSADVMLRKITEQKEKANENFIKRLQNLSIEKVKC